jgi:hypothetical protein
MSLRKKFNFAAKVGASALTGVLIKAGVVSGAGVLGVSAGYGIAIAAAGAALTNCAITTFEYARKKDKKLWSKDYRRALVKGMTTSALVGGALSFLVPGLGHLLGDAWQSEVAESVRSFIQDKFSGSSVTAVADTSAQVPALDMAAEFTSQPPATSEELTLTPKKIFIAESTQISAPELAESGQIESTCAAPETFDENASATPAGEGEAGAKEITADEADTSREARENETMKHAAENNENPAAEKQGAAYPDDPAKEEVRTEKTETTAGPGDPAEKAESAKASENMAEETTEKPVPFSDWGNLNESNLEEAVQQFMPEETPPVLEDIMTRMNSEDAAVKAQAVKDFAHGLYNSEFALPKDTQAAFAINHLAIEISNGENAQAVFNEAYSYLHGIGTEADIGKARNGFLIALDLGYEKSCGHLEYMKDVGYIDDIPGQCEAGGSSAVQPDEAERLAGKFDQCSDPENVCFENNRLEKIWWSTDPDGCISHYASNYSQPNINLGL